MSLMGLLLMDMAEERISEVEDISIETPQANRKDRKSRTEYPRTVGQP